MAGDCCVFRFLRRSVNGRHLMNFQSEISLLKYPWRSVDGVKVKNSLFYIPYSTFPIPHFLFHIPYSTFPILQNCAG